MSIKKIIMGKGINPNCFDSVGADCIEINGDESLSQFVDRVDEEIRCLKDNACDPCNNCKGKVDSVTSSNSGASFPVNVGSNSYTSNVPFKVSVKTNNINTTLEYDLNGVLSSGEYTSLKVNIYGSRSGFSTVLHSSNSLYNSFNLKPNSFPVSLDIEAIKLAGSSQRIYKFSKTYVNSDYSSDEYFNITDLGAPTIEDQSSYNDYLQKQLSSLRTELNAIKNLNFNGGEDLPNSLSTLKNEIDKNADNLTSAQEEVEEDISNILKEIQTINTTLVSQNNAIQAIQSRIDTINTILGIN